MRILHLEAGLINPFHNCWQVNIMLLKGAKRALGVAIKQKLPITPDILRSMFTLAGRLLFSSPLDVTFWASCIVAFFSFFRKSNLLVKSLASFDPSLHLCRKDASFSHEAVTLAVRWSKTIQYRQRTLHIPLPRITDCPLCPTPAMPSPTHTLIPLILCLRLCDSPLTLRCLPGPTHHAAVSSL